MAIEYKSGPAPLGVIDPNAKLDYTLDWSRYLYTLGEDVISQSEWLIEGTVAISQSPAPSHTDKTTTVWLEGNDAAVDEKITVTNRITTVGGRIEDRSFTLTVQKA